MTTIAELKQQYPAYADVPDQELADRLYAKHYEGRIDRAEFDRRVGLAPAQEQGPSVDRALEGLGIDPDLERGTLLPLGRTEDGRVILALPEFAVEAVRGALAPGVVAQGGKVSTRDIMNTAFVATPASAAGRVSRGASTAARPQIGQRAAQDITPDVQPGIRQRVAGRSGAQAADTPIQPTPRGNLDDFQAVNVPPDAVSLSGSDTLAYLRSGMDATPIVRSPVVKRARSQVAGAAQAREEIAGAFGSRLQEESLGDVVEKGVLRFAREMGDEGQVAEAIRLPARMTSMRTKQRALYDRVQRQIDSTLKERTGRVGASNVDVKKLQIVDPESTRSALRAIQSRYDDRALGALFNNPRFKQFAAAIDPEPTSPSFPGNPGGRIAVPDVRRQGGAGRVNTTRAVDVPRGQARAMDVTPAQRGLSYRDARNFRTQLRMLSEDEDLARTISQGDWSSLRRAMAEDIERGVRENIGGDAARQMRRADRFSRAAAERIDDALERFYDTKNAGQAFAMIERSAKVNASSSDASKLFALKRTLKPEEWNEVASTYVRRLGRPTAANTGEFGFSVNTFAKNWDDISGRAKDALFSSPGMAEHRARLESLARVTNSLKDAERLANPSRSGSIAMLISLVAGGITPATQMATAGVVGTGYALSSAMMSPAFVTWLTKAVRLYGRVQTQAARVASPAARSLRSERELLDHLSRIQALAAREPGLEPIARLMAPTQEPSQESRTEQL